MLFTTILLAVSLSLDAFSMSLAYGLLNFSNKKILLVSLLIGIFHFFMPILGMLIGKKLFSFIHIDPKYIISIIFLFIIIEMIKSLKNEEIETRLTILESFLFAFAVSIDSFSVGIGLAFLGTSILLSCSIFTISSFLFTFTGFKLGKYFNKKLGKISKIIGIILLSFLTLMFLCK